ncbi:glycoside hydrolase family 3 N-terminal domain-containing protein, partial [Paenibacillus chitinolyticus]|uniref:glycoside hydrolase family 3 protein n=1 Tax=Paenibacillus chitinolyticus TaxID=79263 RepID=UPI002DBEB89C
MKLSTITLDELTLEQKVGQLFTFYHLQPYFSDFAEKAVRDWHAGGLFLDMESLIDPAQVREMTDAMQRAARETESGIPLFIAADFVAGAGCKLRDGGAVHFPKNKAVGAAGDASLAYELGRITALESLELGVNFNYSPVVDINNNPLNPVIGTHSFGEDAALVTEMGRAVIRGMQEHGMIATAKHFPGHGDTRVDSHHDLPVLAFGRERLESFELAPFRGAIEAGVEAVMVGHIAVPAFDPSGMPASLSQAMTTGILREELGFGGLIVTDGLSMKGVTSRFSQAEACVLALKAGADVLLAHALTAEEGREMVDRVLAAVRGGEIGQARINEAAARVLKLKEKYIYAAAGEGNAPGEPAALLHPDSERVSLAIARKALRDHGGFGRLLGSAAGTAEPERGTRPKPSPMTLGASGPLGGPPQGDASQGERPGELPGAQSGASGASVRG